MVAILGEPGAKLLVYGHRRMGKTSALVRAVARVNRLGGRAFIVDLSTASNPVDMGTRVLRSASETLGRRWRDLPRSLLEMIGAKVKLTIDPRSNMPTATFEAALREGSIEEQRKSLGEALDAIDRLAGERKLVVGVVLDEFQEISRFGGEAAEWHLRGHIQHHANISYILAGSRTRLINRMLDKDRAFYGLLETLHFGPIEADQLARWIDHRMKSGGVGGIKIGKEAIEAAGPRTRDIIQLARKCYDRVRTLRSVRTGDLEAAFTEIVAEGSDLYWTVWRDLTQHQQNVLRAVAAGDAGLTTKRTRSLFSLGDSGTTSNTAAAMIEDDRLLKNRQSATGYEFDNPFYRAWVVRQTLADLGMTAFPAPVP